MITFAAHNDTARARLDAINRANERRRNLRDTAHTLLILLNRCPELFEQILPIDADTRRTLEEIAFAEDDTP